MSGTAPSDPPNPAAYANPPKPGTYLITSRAVPSNCMEVHPRNERRVVCSPNDGSNRQLWYIQRFGKGYKIKNVMYNMYLSAPASRENTVVEASTRPTMWNLMRTHDGFARVYSPTITALIQSLIDGMSSSIQYGEEDAVIDLHGGHRTSASVLYLASLDGVKLDPRRWNFVHKSDDVGGETAETVEDQIEQLRNQIALKEAELAAKDRQLADQQKELQALRRLRPPEFSVPNIDSAGNNVS